MAQQVKEFMIGLGKGSWSLALSSCGGLIDRRAHRSSRAVLSPSATTLLNWGLLSSIPSVSTAWRDWDCGTGLQRVGTVHLSCKSWCEHCQSVSYYFFFNKKILVNFVRLHLFPTSFKTSGRLQTRAELKALLLSKPQPLCTMLACRGRGCCCCCFFLESWGPQGCPNGSVYLNLLSTFSLGAHFV